MQLRKHWAFGGLIVCLVAPHIVVAADGPSPSLSVAASGAASTSSLESMVARALASHPEIESLRMAQDAASAAREQAGLIANPEFSYSMEDRGKVTENRTWELAQPIELGGKRAARQRLGDSDHELARQALRQKEIEVIARVHAAYFQLALAVSREKQAEANHDVAQRFSTIVEKRAAAGKVAPLEASKSRQPALLAGNELSQARQQRQLTRERLAILLGSSVNELGEPASALPSLALDWGQLQERLKQAPGARMAAQQQERQIADLAVQRSLAIPNIQVRAGIKETPELHERGLTLGVSIPIPLLNRNQGAIGQAQARVYQAQAEAQASTRQIELEARTLWGDITNLQRSMALYERDLLPTSNTAFDAARLGYELGKFQFLDVLDAQRSLLTSSNDYLTIQAQYIDALTRLEILLGVDLLTASATNTGAKQ